jgi:queuosine biosynthesis protein QueC
MSGLVAALINKDDAGIRKSNDDQMRLACQRGSEAIGYTFHPWGAGESGTFKLFGRDRNSTRLASFEAGPQYTLLGCATSASATQPLSEGNVAPFTHGNWCVVVDGAIQGKTGLELARLLDHRGPQVFAELKGQFALIAFDRRDPRVLWWATKAKPLHGLYDTLDRGVRIASQADAFFGMYHQVRSPAPVQLGPYAHGILGHDGRMTSVPYDRNTGIGTLVLSGGGLDTLVAGWEIATLHPHESVTFFHVDYGQKAKMRERAATIAFSVVLNRSGILTVKDSAGFDGHRTEFFKEHAGSRLTSGRVSHSPQAGVPSEWVPARNTVLLSLGLAYAEYGAYSRVVLGINQDAASAYPDNETEWAERWEALIPYAVGLDRQVELETPLRGLSKAQIVTLGERYKIPWADANSWSCYEGSPDGHCGTCSSCRARKGAFARAGVTDPTAYKE